MSDASEEKKGPGYGLLGLAGVGILASLVSIFLYVPTEKTEGAVQRIMYFHVPSAWIAFLLHFFIVFPVQYFCTCGRRKREWDIYAHASAEIGIIFCSLVLITGPLWAKPVWNAWWVWDPRLTLTLVLWLIYVAYLMLRTQSEAGATRAKYAAVIGIVGFLDIPLIHFFGSLVARSSSATENSYPRGLWNWYGFQDVDDADDFPGGLHSPLFSFDEPSDTARTDEG